MHQIDFIQFFGRLHPLLLHLPIGILLLAALTILYKHIKKKPYQHPLMHTMLLWGTLTGIFTAISGYILATEGGYDENMVSDHQWAGYFTTGLAIFMYISYRLQWKKVLPLASAVLVVSIALTGHLGGAMTHGSEFLLEPFQADQGSDEVVTGNFEEQVVFSSLIEPILREKCNGCHNRSKQKGDLLLETVAGIRKGGKSGKLFIPGDADGSLMLQRIHLPEAEKKHMPPKGKIQLTRDEIRLLEWWINEGGEFEDRIKEYTIEQDMQSLLDKYFVPQKDVFSLKLEEANPGVIRRLEKSGFELDPVSLEKPFLSASLKGRQDLDAGTFRKLKKIAPQLIHLDLSETNLDDGLMRHLPDFPHLHRLYLRGTRINGTGLRHLEDHPYLAYLNLVGTAVDSAALAHLAAIPSLQKLYLWGTSLTNEQTMPLQDARPTLMLDIGARREIFGSARLKAPLIQADRDIFMDSLTVRFDINFPGVGMYYTLDGSEPDSLAQKYEAPFTIDETAEVRVIAQKEGWVKSETASRVFIRAKYQPVSVKLDKQPHPNYIAKGAQSLTDFVKGTTIFRDGNWLGFEQTHFTATFDLGAQRDVSSIVVSTLESTDQWIFFPRGLEVSISADGSNFREVASKSYPVTRAPEPPSTKHFKLPFDTQQGRFVRVRVLSHIVNPAWHPAAGEPCWVFVDEVLIE